MTFVQPGIRREQEVAYGQTSQRLYCWPELDGVVIDPASTTVDVFLPGQVSSPEVSAGAVTEDSTTHQLYYALNASDTGKFALGLRCMFIFTCTRTLLPSVQIKRTFQVVRTPMVHNPPCQAGDLLNAHVSVEDALIQGGYVVDPDAAEDDLEADPSRFIVQAWEEVLNWLEGYGKTPGRIANPECLAPLLRARACALMFRALSRQVGDLFGKLKDDFQADYVAIQRSPPTLIDDTFDSHEATLLDVPQQPIIGISGREHARRRVPVPRGFR